jgi:hypothetical protein
MWWLKNKEVDDGNSHVLGLDKHVELTNFCSRESELMKIHCWQSQVMKNTSNTVLFRSNRQSRTPLSIMNFGRGHASLGPLSNLQVVTQAPNCQKKIKNKKTKKTKISVQMPKFSRCHAKFWWLPNVE